MIRVVIDTSALVSAVLQGRLRPYVTPVVLEEYIKVFEYERLKHLDIGFTSLVRLPKTSSRIARSQVPRGQRYVSEARPQGSVPRRVNGY